jgi:D-alanyl-D-alanine carboxypeptidase
LQASNPDALRHPASLTKIMTLYLLFERLEAGKIKLDSQLKVSLHASEQAPTKLALKPGETIAVEDAIKAIITKSANDAAVVVAENLGGDEDQIAKLMTKKARTLGMTRTTYVNASGLPDDDQITTARDQALLGRLIQKRFPRYYKYFSTESFVYRGEVMRNHNNLLGSIEGVDGIKTGFTRASGFNLVTSMHRDGHYIVAVVMGGRSSFERDAHMRELINSNIKEGVVATSNQPNNQPVLANAPRASQGNSVDPIQLLSVRTIVQATMVQSGSLAPMKALRPLAPAEPQPSVQVAARWLPSAPIDDAPMGSHGDPTAPNPPLLVKTIKIQTGSIEASLAPTPAPAPVVPAVPQPGTVVAARWVSVPSADRSRTVVASADPMPIAQSPMPAWPAVLDPAEAKAERIQPAKLATARIELPKVESESASVNLQVANSATYAQPRSQSGWLIQIGAFDREDEAREHLSTARLKMRNALAAADSSTERVQIGGKILYRARFTGFDKETAAAACQQLRRSDMGCIVLRN